VFAAHQQGVTTMKKVYLSFGLVFFVVLGPEQASAFGMGGMGGGFRGAGPPRAGLYNGGRAFGVGGFSRAGFRAMSPGARPYVNSYHVSGAAREGFYGGGRAIVRGYRSFGQYGGRPGIGVQNRANMSSPDQARKLSSVNSTGSRTKNNRHGYGRPGSPASSLQSTGPDVGGRNGGLAAGSNLGSAGSAYYGSGSYSPASYATRNYDAASAGGAQECALIRTKKPTNDGGYRWVIAERCE